MPCFCYAAIVLINPTAFHLVSVVSALIAYKVWPKHFAFDLNRRGSQTGFCLLHSFREVDHGQAFLFGAMGADVRHWRG